MYHSLFNIYTLQAIWVVSCFWLLPIQIQAFMHKFLCEYAFLLLWYKCPGVRNCWIMRQLNVNFLLLLFVCVVFKENVKLLQNLLNGMVFLCHFTSHRKYKSDPGSQHISQHFVFSVGSFLPFRCITYHNLPLMVILSIWVNYIKLPPSKSFTLFTFYKTVVPKLNSSI